jgi:hypothetical protein
MVRRSKTRSKGPVTDGDGPARAAGPGGLLMGRVDPFWCRSCKQVWTRFTAYDKLPIPQVCRECGQEAKPWPCKCPQCGKKLQADQPCIIAD